MILLVEDRRDAGPTGNDCVFSVTFADLDVVGGTGVPPVLCGFQKINRLPCRAHGIVRVSAQFHMQAPLVASCF